MRFKHWFTVTAIAGLACGSAAAQEQARVLSATPVWQQIGIPQQVCEDEQVYSGQQTNGTGAILGAVIGGVAGNALGRGSSYSGHRGYSHRGYRGHGGYGHHSYHGHSGSNRAATTIVGAIAGGLIGNVIESSNSQPRYETVRRCTNELVYENRTVGYDVTYEYAGRRYTTRMDNHPGAWVPVSVQAHQPAPSTWGSAERFVGPSGVYQPAPAGTAVTENIYSTAPAYPASAPPSAYWR